MKAKYVLLFLSITLLLQQCAKQTAPTGGPKDEIPPSLESSTPKHKAVNFKGEEIELSFNELIQLNNPREQIIITPSIGKKFEVTARKNKVILKFNTKLQDSTTYTINFRESIQDLTEKNPADIKLAFSTGTYIDSLNITGSVSDILTAKEEANYTVALTQASDTFNIFKHAASWVTLTNKQGKFALENLKQGKYFIYAFHDQNKNLIADSKSENYGFKSEVINLQKSIDSLKIHTFKLDAGKLKLLSSRPAFAYFNIRLSKSLTSYKLTPIDTTQKIYSVLEPDLASIKVFNTIGNQDSVQIRLQAQDSLSLNIDTLIYVKFQQRESTKDKFTHTIEFANLYESTSLFSSAISFNKPITYINIDSIYIEVDSVTRINFTNQDFQWNQNFTRLTLTKKVDIKSPPADLNQPNTKPPDGPKFIMSKNSVISIENDSIPSLTSPVRRIKVEENGVIFTKIQTSENFTLQLIDKAGKIVQEVKNSRNHSFENVPAGNYILRLLVDLNKNGKWDGGSFTTKTQPEPVIFYTNPKGGKDIFLKANWQVGPLLISY